VQHTQVLVGAARKSHARAGFVRSVWFRIAIGAGQFAIDAGLIFLAFWLAYGLRYDWELGGLVQPADYEPFETFRSRALLLIAFTLLTFSVRGLYRLPRSTGMLDEATMVVGGVTTAMAGVILTAFLSRFVPSRLVFIYAWAIAVVLLVGRRYLTRIARRMLWARQINVDRVIVVGAGAPGRRIMQAMMATPQLGYRVVGFVDDSLSGEGLAVATEVGLSRADRLGFTEDLERLVADHDVDEVIIALPASDNQRALDIIDHCRQQDVRFKVVPDLIQLSLDRVDLGEVAGVPLIGLKEAAIRGTNYAIKRGIDFALATVVLVVMAIPMVVIAVVIRAGSPGPALYRQQRVGRDGRIFTLTKFRCMVQNADDQRAELMAMHGHMDPRLFKLRDDPRLTREGRWLRRFSLDELPQFFQVLRGHMSVVGPRPQMPEEVKTYEEWHRQRMLVTPGLTGLWQVNGRSNLTFDEMVRLDLYYAEHWSLWLDIKIVLRTIPAVLTGRGAY
jgi:exopolysaccharide biosynthesis polyprenyl glycosylphosphotransferase